jgi:hypothetical protein
MVEEKPEEIVMTPEEPLEQPEILAPEQDSLIGYSQNANPVTVISNPYM